MDQKEWNKEHKRVIAEEKRFLSSGMKEKKSVINQTVEKVVPDGLQNKLNTAFIKGFELVFSKGIPVVEKTYNKSRREEEYKINEFALEQKKRRSLQGFKKSTNRSIRKNVFLSGAEGISLGILGIGLPDIPIFIGMIMKSIQEIAVSYGFEYHTEREKIFILKLIRTAISNGDSLIEENRNIGRMICGIDIKEDTVVSEIEKTANVLSERLLYMKFVQGIPIVGVVGGLSDYTVMKDITRYARLIYKKRFLRKLWEEHFRN